jgi:tRNA(fMet)-specific endonuclease VapC
MTILDTDIFSLLAAGHPRVRERLAAEMDGAGITIVTRIEVLEGRFAAVKKAENGEGLLRAQQWLQRSEADLATLDHIPFDAAAAAQFDRLRQNKKLKKVDRGDLLIANIALAHRATLATRNLRDFRLIPGLGMENWAD